MSINSKSSNLHPSNPTPRTRVMRECQRAVVRRAPSTRVSDEALLCHVGFVANSNSDFQPFVIPMSYGRDGDVLYIHGSPASRMMRHLEPGVPVCVTVTLVDGLVLARSRLQSLDELPLGDDSRARQRRLTIRQKNSQPCAR